MRWEKFLYSDNSVILESYLWGWELRKDRYERKWGQLEKGSDRVVNWFDIGDMVLKRVVKWEYNIKWLRWLE